MSLFRRPAADESRGVIWPGYPYPPSAFSGGNSSGVAVNLETYTRSAASWACVRVLVSTVKKLPVDVIRYVNDTRVPLVTQPQIVARPSALVRRRVWVAQIMRSMCSAGNAYGDIVEIGSNFKPATIETLAPSRVTWRIYNGEWKCQVDGRDRDLWPNGDLWHLAASDYTPAGQPFALSPVEQARTSIGTGIAAEEFGAKFFGDGAHPSSAIFSEQELTQEQAAAIKRTFINSMSGTREPAVFGAGLRFEKLTVDPKDSQFIDLLRFEVEQACRWWGVPPSMVYAAISGQNVTYSNVSQSDLAFLKHSVDNWLVDIEDAWSELLPQPQMVKFNTSAMLRMDDETRWKVHDLRLKNKTTSINAVRRLEDELPFPDAEFDQPGIPGGAEQAPIAVTDSGGTAL